MSDYQGNIIIKNPATPTGPSTFGRAPGMWKLSDVAYWIKQGVWPNTSIIPDQYFPYVSLLLSTTSLGNANNNLFVDSSGVLNPVSRGGNTTQGSFTPYATNWSNYFDGSGDYLSLASNDAFRVDQGDWTMEAWVYLNTTATNHTFINRGTYLSAYSFYFGTSGTSLYYEAGTGGWAATPYTSSAGAVSANQWIHVAAVRSGTSLFLYANGTRVLNQASASFGANTATPVWIGTYLGGTATLNGNMSNFRFVKGTAVYTGATYTVPTAPLTAITNTSLLTCQSNRFRDASSNNFTITVNGNPSVQDFNPFSPSTYAPIAYNQSDITNWSGYFDGSGDYLNTAASSSLGLTGDWTVEGWLYQTSTAGAQIFLDTRGSGATGFGIYCSLTGFSGGPGAFGYATNSALVAVSSTVIPLNAWTHLAVTRSGNTITGYINGVSAFTYTEGRTLSSTMSYFIGADYVGTSNAYGYMSNFRVVRGTAVYTGNFTPPTTNLTAISGTSLLTLQNAAFTDNSTNNFVITPNGNVTVTGNSPFNTVGYWSNYFDGNDYIQAPDNAAFAFGTGDYTVEAWVYPTSIRNGENLIYVTEVTQGMAFGYNQTQVYIGARATAYDLLATYTMPTNQWVHVAATRQSGTARIFVNGTQVGSGTITRNNPQGAGTVGDYTGASNGNGVTGYISNVRVVKGTAVYTSNFTVPTAPLTAITNTSLLTCQNGRYIDNSTNAFTITPYGNTSIQSFDPFYTSTVASNGGSMYFSSTNTGALETILNVPASNNIDIGAGDFTVECWVYLTATQNYSRIIQFNNTWNSAGAVAMIYAATDVQKLGFASYDLSAAVLADSTYQFNTWYHVAVTRVGNVFSLFINGIKQAATATSSGRLWATTTPFMSIGNGPTSAGGFSPTQCYVSDVRIIRGTAIYTASFTPPTAPLTPTPATVLLVNGMNAGIYDATTINDMTTIGNAQVRYPSPFAPANYWAGAFDGSGDYLSVPSSSALNFGTGDFTVELWAYWNVVDSTCFVSGSADGSMDFVYSTNGDLRIGRINVTWDTIFPTWNPVAGVWYHIAFTRSSGTTRAFVNGTQIGSSQTNTVSYSSASSLIVGSSTTSFRQMNGYFSNLRLVKGTAVYTSNFTPPTEPLTAISGTSLLTCQNKTFIDNSSNAFTITANGNATAGAIGPFTATGGTSMYFDGTGDYLVTRSTPDLDFGSGDFTVEFWAYPTVKTNVVDAAFGYGSFTLMCYHNGTNWTAEGSNNGSSLQFQISTPVTLNTWQLITITRSGTTIRLFKDGVIGATGSLTGAINTAGKTLRVGDNGNSQFFTGYLDDFRITRGVARYTANFTPPTQAFPTY